MVSAEFDAEFLLGPVVASGTCSCLGVVRNSVSALQVVRAGASRFLVLEGGALGSGFYAGSSGGSRAALSSASRASLLEDCWR